MRMTEAQRRAVSAPGSVAVVAGAGCGKTSLLAERYVHHLREDGLSPLQVVAVTFTEKAAEELRSRIRGRVLGAVPDAEEASAELEAAQISTIHALCARVCREHPEEAGVPPDFSVLDEVLDGVWVSERVLDALDALPPETYEVLHYEALKEAVEALLSDPIPAARALERAREDGLEGWAELAAQVRARSVAGFLGSWVVREHADVLRSSSGAEGDLMENQRTAAVAAMDALRTARPEVDPDGVEQAFEALEGIQLRGGKRANWPEGELALVKDALKGLRELAKEEKKRGLATLRVGPVDELLAEMIPVLGDAFARVAREVGEAKWRARVLDFSDLEVCALRALESEEVREYYRERWRVFLIDECQDTNPVQAEILELLTGGAKLTVVGDEKQSIYGFRRADVEVFRRFRARILAEPEGAEEVLSTTFRCHEGLISKLNATFSPILGDLHQSLSAHRADPPHAAPHVRLYAVESEEKVGKAALERAEAAHIALLIREMIEGGVEVHDGHGARPAEPGDFAILSRTWAPLDGCGEALNAAGIPSIHAGGGNLLDTREVKDGLALLRFLAEPNDDLALVALLRSPFFAVDDPTLHRIALGRAEGQPWWSAVGADGGHSAALSAARDVLNELLSRSRREAPSHLLAAADHLTGYTAVIANLPGAARREADWRGFMELVRGLERGHEDAFAVTRALRRMGEAGVGVPRPVVSAEGAVSLMTIHSAKGLEWPVVVVPDLSRAPQSSSPTVLFDPEVGVGLDLVGDEAEDGDDEPVVFKLVKDRAEVARRAEDKRLLYVALTRARDHLVMTTTDGRTERDCGLAVLRPGLLAAGIEVEPVPFRPPPTQQPEASAFPSTAYARLLL